MLQKTQLNSKTHLAKILVTIFKDAEVMYYTQVINNTEYSVLDMLEFTNPDYPDEPDYFKVIILRSKTGEVFPF